MAAENREVEASAVSTWLQNKAVEASLDNTVLLYELYQAGQIKPQDFGDGVKLATQIALPQVKATDASGTGMTQLTDSVLEYARAEWKTLPAEKTIDKEAFDVEASKAKKVSWLMAEFGSLQNTIINTADAMLWGDGTGDSGYAFDGMAQWIAKDPSSTIAGGIDPALVTQWQNLSINFLDSANLLATDPTTEPGTEMSATNIGPRVRAIINRMALNGGNSTHIFLSSDWYSLFEQYVEEKERLVNKDNDVKAGFRNFYYKGVKICNAGGLKRRTDGAYTGLGEKEMYFVNIKDIHLFYHRMYDSKARELGIERDKINALVYPQATNGIILNDVQGRLQYYVKMVMKGNLILGDRQRHAVAYEEAIA